jgi:trigger factor
MMGGAPIEGASADAVAVEVGAGGYIPGFAEALEGAKVPSERTFPIRFPEDYSAEHLRGREATFTVQIKEIKTKEIPDLSDEFAKDVGVESLEALRQKVRDRLHAAKKSEAETKQRNALVKSLVEANPIEVPPSIVRAHAERLVAGARAQVEQMVGERINLSDTDLAALTGDSHATALFQVKAGMLLAEVAKKTELQVDDAEVSAEINRMLGGPEAGDERFRTYLNRPEERDRIRYRLLEDKAVSHLLAQAELADPSEFTDATADAASGQ